MTGKPTVPSTLDVHRLLDEAFAEVSMTPEVQDLKEEMRADLVVRAAELERTGHDPGAAARRAVQELGDIRSVVDEMGTVPGSRWTAQRVRPRPAFVVRTVVLALAGAAALAVGVLGVATAAVPPVGTGLAAIALALVAGALVADGLRQETTNSYPLPRPRALGYGVAAVLAVGGAGAAAGYLRDPRLAWLIGGGLGVLAGVVGFTYLGATQTNRHKPWVVRMQAAQADAGDRFARDPAAAARFGLYTVTIWTVTLAAFAVLTIAIGWAWSWLALVAGLVGFLLTLARMLFVPDASTERPGSSEQRSS